MSYTEYFSYISSDGKTKINARCSIPNSNNYKGIIQISHGMCEYIDRYEHVFSFFTQHGFIVCGNDHLGHGKTADKDSLGVFSKENGHIYLIEDLHKLTEIIKKKFDNLPYFLLGHSMGSFIARLYCEKYSYELNAAIFSGTGGPNNASKLGIKTAHSISSLKGHKYKSKLLDSLAFGSYNKKCSPLRTDKDWLSRDKNIVNSYIADPLCMFTFSASAFKDLFTLYTNANSESWAQNINKNLPIYLFSGDMDPVGDYGKGVKHVYKMLKNKGVKDLTIKLYVGGRHEMLNEINKLQVMEDLLAWINKHLPNND